MIYTQAQPVTTTGQKATAWLVGLTLAVLFAGLWAYTVVWWAAGMVERTPAPKWHEDYRVWHGFNASNGRFNAGATTDTGKLQPTTSDAYLQWGESKILTN